MCGSSLHSRHVCAREETHFVHPDAGQSQEQQHKKAIIANADAKLLCALAECAYNILTKNIPLTALQRRRLGKYRTKLRELARRNKTAARRKRLLLPQIGEGQSGGFLSAFLAPLAGSVLLPLLRQVLTGN